MHSQKTSFRPIVELTIVQILAWYIGAHSKQQSCPTVEQTICWDELLTETEYMHGDAWMADCVKEISAVKERLTK